METHEERVDLEIAKESVIIQLNEMIHKIKNDEDYFKKIMSEPVFYGSQMWLGKGMEFIRMDLQIIRKEMKLPE